MNKLWIFIKYLFISAFWWFVSSFIVGLILLLVQQSIIKFFFIEAYDWMELNNAKLAMIISIPIGLLVGLIMSGGPIVNPDTSMLIMQSGLNNKLNETQNVPKNNSNKETLQCPKCYSSNLTANKKGFGLGKAAIGGALVGGVGLLGGLIGKDKIKLTCLKCGYSWTAGEG